MTRGNTDRGIRNMTGLQILTRGCLAAVTTAALLTTVLAGAQAEVRFLDHRGQVIVLESPPQKIVSMFASGPLVYYAVDGKSDRIAGVNIKGVKMYRDSIYAELAHSLRGQQRTSDPPAYFG
jgi:ABC-type Fe3+-hydroxamate transport system substrate-binding protein